MKKLVSIFLILYTSFSFAQSITITVADTANGTVKIPPVFGISWNNMDKKCQVQGNAAITASVAQIHANVLAEGNGSNAARYHVFDSTGKPGKGWNCKDPNCDECVTGITYSSLKDFLFTADTMNVNSIFVTGDIADNLTNIPRFLAEIDTMKLWAKKRNLTIGYFMYGAEEHTNMDATTYCNFVNQVKAAVTLKLPGAIQIADTYGNQKWDQALLALGLPGVRIYYQFEASDNTIPSQYISRALSVRDTVRARQKQYPGKLICISQTETKTGHPLYATVTNMNGDVLLYASIAKENVADGGVVCYCGQFNLGSLYEAKTLRQLPTYYAVMEVKKIFGLTYVSTSATGAPGLFTIGGRDASGKYSVIIVNQNSTAVNLSKLTLNGTRKSSYTVTTYSGLPSAVDVKIDNDNLLDANSFSLISF